MLAAVFKWLIKLRCSPCVHWCRVFFRARASQWTWCLYNVEMTHLYCGHTALVYSQCSKCDPASTDGRFAERSQHSGRGAGQDERRARHRVHVAHALVRRRRLRQAGEQWRSSASWHGPNARRTTGLLAASEHRLGWFLKQIKIKVMRKWQWMKLETCDMQNVYMHTKVLLIRYDPCIRHILLGFSESGLFPNFAFSN